MGWIIRRSSQAAAALTGLDWDGTGTVKRGLYWTTAVPDMAPMTVLMKKYPRVLAATERRYYCDFFWGNYGQFNYDLGGSDNYANAYVGFHPYPRPNTDPQGNGHWEVAVGTNFGTASDITLRDDTVSDPEVTWNTWHSQALTVRNTTGTQHEHKLYVDLPNVDSVNTITVTRLSDWEEPPQRSIMIGQTADYLGESWGGEPRWEETNSIIRGIQIYAAVLTQQQILDRAACETDAEVSALNTADGITAWYHNMNPTPTDVTDKSGAGHHGSWDHVSNRPDLWTE